METILKLTLSPHNDLIIVSGFQIYQDYQDICISINVGIQPSKQVYHLRSEGKNDSQLVSGITPAKERTVFLILCPMDGPGFQVRPSQSVECLAAIISQTGDLCPHSVDTNWHFTQKLIWSNSDFREPHNRIKNLGHIYSQTKSIDFEKLCSNMRS